MIERELRACAGDWLAAGRDGIVVEVVEAVGSVPRGSWYAHARRARRPRRHHRRRPPRAEGRRDGPSDARARRRRRAAPAIPARPGPRPVLRRVVDAVVRATVGAGAGTLADAAAAVPSAAARRGHVGRAIATLLATLDVDVHWFDQRDEGFPATTNLGSPWPARIRRTSIDTVEAEVRQAPPGAFYLVLTHEHALDLRITEAVLRRGDFAFCGLIGSKTKRARFTRRLAERGVTAAALARLACPIGVDGIDGIEAKAPELIAAAVVAQLLIVNSRARAGVGAGTVAT
jgi:xanthine dehydrogenase accessory factor